MKNFIKVLLILLAIFVVVPAGCDFGDSGSGGGDNPPPKPEPVYELNLTKDEITIGESFALNYDYKSLFVATVDGVNAEITDDMVTSDVKGETGDYTYKVVFHEISKTLAVHVVADHFIDVVPSYALCEITLEELASFDYKTLFSLYVDGAPVQITDEMLTVPSSEGAKVGDEFEVTLDYTIGKTSASKTAKIKIVEVGGVVLTAKNIVTYPNGGNIDLTSLFEITDNGVTVPVTSDMVSGSVNYSKSGVNEITLTYKGQTCVARVEVTIGVIINYTTGDVITVKKGTDKNTYSFAGDFSVIINGVRFIGIDESYFEGLDELDFNVGGDYEVTLKIPYNSSNLPLTGNPRFDYTSKTITYKVVENDYVMSVKEELVTLSKGTTSYDVTSNVSLSVNGYNQKLTTNPEWVSLMATYYEEVSGVDFDFKGNQTIVLDVYVYGVDEKPVRVSYDLIIKSDIRITATDAVIFSGNALYPLDLFEITVDGEEVKPTADMITGRIDVFTAGRYSVTLNYEGLEATAEILVMEKDIVGTYKTSLVTISKDSEEDEDGYVSEGTKSQPVGDMVINEDGTMTVAGKTAHMVRGLDANTLDVVVGTNDYKLYYDNGVVVLDPDNSIKLAFSDYKRPYLYVNDALWTLEDNVTINSNSTYILNNTNTGYSIDVFKITSKDGSVSKWYGLKVRLTDKTSADTVYSVEWGEVTFADNFEKQTGVVSSLTLNDVTYNFTMQTRYVGKTNGKDTSKEYANMTFTGRVDGKNATLAFGTFENVTYTVGGTKIFTFGVSEYNNLKYGGVDHAMKTLTVYQVREKNSEDAEIFSYVFNLDPVNKTFELVEKDGATGQYVADGKYIFLDGYGKGIINYNTNSYVRTPITYKINNNEITIKYLDVSPAFEYGESATFYMDDFMNVLTVKSFTGEDLVGTRFINNVIKKGAIVTMNRFKFDQGTDTERRADLLNALEIVTADGTLTYEQKEEWRKSKIINLSKIKFSTPGFYQFSIDLTVDGVKTTSYYAIEVIALKYQGSVIAQKYGRGVLNGNSLTLTEYGVATLEADGTAFNGYFNVTGENSFVAKMYDKNNRYVCLEGTIVKEGVLQVVADGAVRFSDYYTTGSTNVVGYKNKLSNRLTVLRSITVDENVYYVYGNSLTDMGEFVTVELVKGDAVTANGSIIKIINGENVTYARTDAWGNTEKGLTFADDVMGEYKGANGEDTLTFDGFGNGRIVVKDRFDETGTYVIEGANITLVTNNRVLVFNLDKTAKTFTVNNSVPKGNDIVSGKTFNASYMFAVEEDGETTGMYTANTTIEFRESGVVEITSSSEECVEETGSYAPSFVGVGTYSVSLNRITITVNGYTIVLETSSVINASVLSVVSNTISSDTVGYFSTNVKFTL